MVDIKIFHPKKVMVKVKRHGEGYNPLSFVTLKINCDDTEVTFFMKDIAEIIDLKELINNAIINVKDVTN